MSETTAPMPEQQEAANEKQELIKGFLLSLLGFLRWALKAGGVVLYVYAALEAWWVIVPLFGGTPATNAAFFGVLLAATILPTAAVAAKNPKRLWSGMWASGGVLVGLDRYVPANWSPWYVTVPPALFFVSVGVLIARSKRNV